MKKMFHYPDRQLIILQVTREVNVCSLGRLFCQVQFVDCN